MANIAMTQYLIYGSRIKEIYDAIIKLEESEEPIVKNDFGKLFIGCLINKLGGDYRKYPCRGWIINYFLEDDHLYIDQNTAWDEQEGFRQFLEEQYGVEVYYAVEEQLQELKYTNSSEHFPEFEVSLF